MSKAVKTLDKKRFDYVKFKEDVRSYCNVTGTTMAKLSTNVFYKSESYLSGAINNESVPVNIAAELCKRMNIPIKEYEIALIKKKEEKTENKKIAVVEQEERSEKDNEWSCILRVDEEIGVAMLRLYRNGEEIVTGRAYTYGKDIAGIVQGISYAAHQCYKMVQQEKIAVETKDQTGVEEQSVEEIQEDMDEQPVFTRVIFKDWVKKYEKENSKAGSFARYLKSNYSSVPATGRKKIRGYIRLNKGEVHLATFDTLWNMYFKWCDANATECNRILGVG